MENIPQTIGAPMPDSVKKALGSNKPSFMDFLQPPKKRARIITIVGEGGLGKTTLASLFPNPVFIRTEDGSATLEGREDVAMFPLCTTLQDVEDAIDALNQGGHPFRTVILDSITQLSTIIEREIVESDPKAKSINQALGGYGAGYSAMSRAHGRIREKMGALNTKGVHIVFLAHAMSEKLNPPDQPEYLRYSIRMHKDSVSHYSDNVDLVGFLKMKTIVSETKAITTGQRILTCYPTPSHISKNRFGITADIDFVEGVNPLAQYL